MEVPNEAKKLDEILSKCRWRFSNHYPDGEWERFAKEIAGSDSQNPLFKAYINELVNEKYIELAPIGDGYISTLKGLMFKGYKQTFIDDKESEASRQRKTIISNSVTIGAVIIGALLTYFLTPKPISPTTTPIILPEIQLVRDTVIIHDTITIQKNN